MSIAPTEVSARSRGERNIMAQAIVDPQDVLQFARKLKKYRESVSFETSDLRSDLHSLGGTWRDQEYQKFAKELEAAMRSIKRLLATSEDYERYLVRKAEAAQAYLDKR